MIGDTKVRPRVGDTFKRDEKMGIYIQFYNFGPDEKTKKPQGTIEYEIFKSGSTRGSCRKQRRSEPRLPDAAAFQVNVEKEITTLKGSASSGPIYAENESRR